MMYIRQIYAQVNGIKYLGKKKHVQHTHILILVFLSLSLK
jgi:hypothetical protein